VPLVSSDIVHAPQICSYPRPTNISHGVTQQVVFHALTLRVNIQHPHDTTGAVVSVQEPLRPPFVMTKCFSGIPSPFLPLASVVRTCLSHVSSCWCALGICGVGNGVVELQPIICKLSWALSLAFRKGTHHVSEGELRVTHSLNVLILSPQMEPIFPRPNDNSHRGKLVSYPLCSDLIAAEHELQLGVAFQTCA